MKKKPAIEQYGERISLPPPRPADFREYAALMKASRTAFRGLVGNFKGRKQFNNFIRRYERGDDFGFLICRRTDGVIVGSMGLFNIVRLNAKTAFIGYCIGTPHMRQGYATEALQLMLKFAFKKLRLHRVEASIQPPNAPYITLVKRAVFSCEGCSRRLVKIAGRWRDHERLAILAEEWRSHK